MRHRPPARLTSAATSAARLPLARRGGGTEWKRIWQLNLGLNPVADRGSWREKFRTKRVGEACLAAASPALAQATPGFKTVPLDSGDTAWMPTGTALVQFLRPPWCRSWPTQASESQLQLLVLCFSRKSRAPFAADCASAVRTKIMVSILRTAANPGIQRERADRHFEAKRSRKARCTNGTDFRVGGQ
jgi:hypothetical protein